MASGRWVGLVVLFFLGGVAGAQSGDTRALAIQQCGPPPVVTRDSQPNIFSEQQEMWLGQVEADLTERDIQPVRDAALGARLQRIADRLVATLPPTTIHFKVMLVDSDEINGFSIAGGHVYILRKRRRAGGGDRARTGAYCFAPVCV
jgi:predicted Zn-dependent protease